MIIFDRVPNKKSTVEGDRGTHPAIMNPAGSPSTSSRSGMTRVIRPAGPA
jgi:hypothetical protein